MQIKIFQMFISLDFADEVLQLRKKTQIQKLVKCKYYIK